MSNENKTEEAVSSPSHTEIAIEYAGQSQTTAKDSGVELSLFGNIKRDPVSLAGKVKQPMAFREALSTLYAIVGSDYRYKPKDRTAYQAYRRMRNESANKNAWQAQQDYFNWLLRNDPQAFLILDPVISVQPDQLILEVFSKDEGTYANLAIDLSAFELESKPSCGTTNIDFSDALNESIQQFRSYRDTTLRIGQETVAVDVEGKDSTLEKQIKVPDSWLRGFLQVQSAAMLPSDSFTLAPMDIYNCLRHLRMNADVKGKRRGLRVELVPGEAPRLLLEPWETVIESGAGIYQGKQAKVVRLWGRRRLMLLKRLLPFIDSVDVHIAGSGLPCFWVLRCGPMTLTLGLTGFTANDWSQACTFDLLLPRKSEADKSDQTNQALEQVIKYLTQHWFASLNDLAKATQLKKPELIAALQLGCQHGQLMYDIAQQVYRLRPLTNTLLDRPRLEFRNQRERVAHDLLARKNTVTISSENRIYGTGTEVTGKVEVKEDKRDYRPLFLISEEGFVSKAECSCSLFRKQGLKAGPCEHLIALRLAFAKREIQRKNSSKSRSTITVETRTYSRRDKQGEHLYQISLDHKRVNCRWGRTGTNLRLQRFQFNSVEMARNDYLAKVEKLISKGYLDASAD
ncbi:SWIM zinc finger family protein [Spartinivicinus ruber]|uniref:SWIM zinc finger family protein n=1 Tax=Spartinivicinus ruber TaxID=2683272 RepID=UPI0013D55150|nr:SWIM zinc finger family protein [Spartinivicinus ruber]